MNTAYNLEYKAISTTPSKAQDIIDFEINKGWRCIHKETITEDKITFIFQKNTPIPKGSNPEKEVQKYLTKKE